MEYFCNFIWEKGFREKNEDSLCVRQITRNGKDYLLAVICDGIGGLSQGENASSYVVNGMITAFQKMVKRSAKLSSRKARNLFYRQIYRCHKGLWEYGRKQGIELGTTLSMLVIVGNRGYLFHVGDSAFFCGRKKLKKRTVCHHSQSGALLQAVGNGRNPKLQFSMFRIHKNCVYLLASDGFYRRYETGICNKEWIREAVCDEKKIGELLINTKEKVQELGEKDNISAICIRTAGAR